MFGLTFEKLLIIAVIAAFLLGPERLPHYAGKLADLVRALRGFTETAKTRLADELGPEFAETDWKKLDPRQYDPRRIVRDALTDPADRADGAPPPSVGGVASSSDAVPDLMPATTDPFPALATDSGVAPCPARPIAPGGWQEAMLARVAR